MTHGDSQRLTKTHGDSQRRKRCKKTQRDSQIFTLLRLMKRHKSQKVIETHYELQRLTETHRDSWRLTETHRDS